MTFYAVLSYSCLHEYTAAGSSMQGVEMTEAEIYALPVVMTFKQAARAHGIGTKLALQMKAAGTLPFPVRQQGRSWVTTKSELLESLHMPLRPVVAVGTTEQGVA